MSCRKNPDDGVNVLDLIMTEPCSQALLNAWKEHLQLQERFPIETLTEAEINGFHISSSLLLQDQTDLTEK
jgi:hypothetical protein